MCVTTNKMRIFVSYYDVDNYMTYLST